jgi:hypothetical protein
MSQLLLVPGLLCHCYTNGLLLFGNNPAPDSNRDAYLVVNLFRLPEQYRPANCTSRVIID